MRNLVLLILVVIIYYFMKNIFTSVGAHGKQKAEKKKLGEVDDMVKDPSCDTYIPKSRATTMVVDGERVYFCSQECLDKFKKQNS